MQVNRLRLGEISFPLCEHSLGIVFLLRNGPMRTSEIYPSLSVSSALAMYKLKLLKSSGIVAKTSRGYVLTKEGSKLASIFSELVKAGINHKIIYDVLTCKWLYSILKKLGNGPRRWSELMSELHPIRPKVLSERLEKLALNNLAKRIIHDEKPPAVYYELTWSGMVLASWLKERPEFQESA